MGTTVVLRVSYFYTVCILLCVTQVKLVVTAVWIYFQAYMKCLFVVHGDQYGALDDMRLWRFGRHDDDGGPTHPSTQHGWHLF